MPEIDKQEGQKTVVAFIAGLLIGGLLVWVFSASPNNTNSNQNATGDTNTPAAENTTESNDTNSGQTNTTSNSDQTQSTNNTTSQPETVGNGEISVDDQAAGPVVMLKSVTFPTNNGWVAVRDYENGAAGNVLGAARYSKDEGLLPQSVNLLRSTEAGKTYQIVFYNENGDKVFDLSDDTEIQGYSAMFTAQ
jgi:cytoskeletal protein RodZ